MNRLQTLVQYLKCDIDDIEEITYDSFEVDSEEYLVLTDDEADEKALEYIKESVWAFNASFLAEFTGLPEAIFEALQPQCEGANDAILQLIGRGDGLDHFAYKAIGLDGRGHFMSSYDGEETEVGEYFIYRVN